MSDIANSNPDSTAPVRTVEWNRENGWPDLTIPEQSFAIRYAQDGNVRAASKAAKVSMSEGMGFLKNALVRAYVDDILQDSIQETVITRDFLELQMLETLAQVNGDEEVAIVTRDGPIEAKQFNASAKIALLKEMRSFLDVNSINAKNRASFLRKVNPGEVKVYEDPGSLWVAAVEYFQWVEETPVYDVTTKTNGAGRTFEEHVPRVRIPTESALCMHLGVRPDQFEAWGEGDDDWARVVQACRQVIEDVKLTGAAANILNANIISRDLGLADKHDHSSKDGSMSPAPAIDPSKLSTEALAEILSVLRAGKDG